MEKALFKVRISGAIAAKEQTIYRVAVDSGVAFNTVKKYAAGDVETPYLTTEVINMCNYLGLDWHDPQVVEVVKAEPTPGQLKTLNTAVA